MEDVSFCIFLINVNALRGFFKGLEQWFSEFLMHLNPEVIVKADCWAPPPEFLVR